MSSAGITYILAFERDRGTIDRLKLSNFPKDDLVLGLTLTQFITTALQIIVFFLTVYFLGFPGRLDLFLAVFIALLSIVPVLAIGILSSVQLKGEIAFFLPGMLSLPLSFLTGSFIPLPKIVLIGEIQIWHLNPFYSSSEALRKILFLNYDLTQITFELLLLLGVSLPILILSVLLFRKKIYLT
jgi:ABC-type polysaccharide/polyol phosphate export permease